MSSHFNLHVSWPNGASTDSVFPQTARSILNADIRALKSRFGGSGQANATITMRDAAVQATGIITLASVAAADTITIGGIAFTARTSAPGTNEFLVGVSDTADAAAAAVVINATATAGAVGVYNCTSALGVLTITVRIPGVIGNAITIATSNGTRLAITGSATRLAGGAETLYTYTTQEVL